MSLHEAARTPEPPMFVPTEAPEVDPFTEVAKAAETARVAAWDQADQFTWNGRRLEPYSLGRHTTAQMLHRADMTSDDLIDLVGIYERIERHRSAAEASGLELVPRDWELTKFVDITAYLPMATKILWLCAHKPEQWMDLRTKPVAVWLLEIDRWADANIRPDQMLEAVHTAYRLRTDYLRMMTITPPSSGADSGNAHGP